MFKLFSRSRAGSAPSSTREEKEGTEVNDNIKRLHNGLQNRIIICENQEDPKPYCVDKKVEEEKEVEEEDESGEEASQTQAEEYEGEVDLKSPFGMSRSFAEGGLTYHSNRKDARAASLNSLPLSTSAPSRVRALSFSSTPVKLGETDESFGRKVPKHVANQERLFSLIETRKCEPSSPIRYPATVSTSPLRLPSVQQPQPQQPQQPQQQQQSLQPNTTRQPTATTATPTEISKAVPSKPLLSPELKALYEVACRSREKRPSVYQTLLHALNNPANEPLTHESMRGTKHPERIRHAINNDVPRTFGDTDLFKQRGGEGQQQLFRLLMAYALYSPRVGYCQGLNFVVGGLLLAGFSEEEAFWGLHHLMKKHYLEGMFLPGLPGVKKALKRFEAWFSSLMPKLYAHFEEEGIKTEMFTSKWFMSLYSAVLPLDMVVKIWQAFLLHGWVVVWSVGLALLYHAKAVLMKYHFEDILVYIQSVGKQLSANDQEEILKQMNIFMKTIKNQKEQIRLLQSF